MQRINRVISLLEQNKPVYFTAVHELGFKSGQAWAQTWADYLCLDLEHLPFDPHRLHQFMLGLKQEVLEHQIANPPAVLVTLPTDGSTETIVRTNNWMMKQALAAGVHGLMLCHVETPGAVKAFVEGARYAHQSIGVGEQLGQGRRGSAGQDRAAEIWGIPTSDYLDRADVWPLNPNGELLLGIKIEDRRALDQASACAAVPGIALAEWGPGDMGMSFGYKEAHDPPYPPDMWVARQRVKKACDDAGIAFLEVVTPDDVVDQLQDGVQICAACEESARIGRAYTERTIA